MGYRGREYAHPRGLKHLHPEVPVVHQVHREAALRLLHPVKRLKPKDGAGLDVVEHKKAALVLLERLHACLLRVYIWRVGLVRPSTTNK